jgi:hypothetical protein
VTEKSLIQQFREAVKAAAEISGEFSELLDTESIEVVKTAKFREMLAAQRDVERIGNELKKRYR